MRLPTLNKARRAEPPTIDELKAAYEELEAEEKRLKIEWSLRLHSDRPEYAKPRGSHPGGYAVLEEQQKAETHEAERRTSEARWRLKAAEAAAVVTDERGPSLKAELQARAERLEQFRALHDEAYAGRACNCRCNCSVEATS